MKPLGFVGMKNPRRWQVYANLRRKHFSSDCLDHLPHLLHGIFRFYAEPCLSEKHFFGVGVPSLEGLLGFLDILGSFVSRPNIWKTFTSFEKSVPSTRPSVRHFSRSPEVFSARLVVAKEDFDWAKHVVSLANDATPRRSMHGGLSIQDPVAGPEVLGEEIETYIDLLVRERVCGFPKKMLKKSFFSKGESFEWEFWD